MRTAFALLALAGLAAVLWWMLRPAPTPVAGPLSGPGPTAAPDASAEPELDRERPAVARPADEVGGTRAVLPADSGEAEPTAPDPVGLQGDGFLVRVVRAEDGTPIEGAVLYAHSSELFLPEDLSALFAGEMRLETLLRRDAVPRRTNAAGEARVPAPAGGALVRGEAPGRSGLCELRPELEEPIVLELAPARAVHVDVRRADGRPAVGFPLDLSLERASLFRVFTDDEGRADLAPALELSRAMVAELGTRLYVRAAAEANATAELALDLDDLPAEPSTLVLPPLGAVRVTLTGVDPDGPRPTVRLRAAPEGLGPDAAVDPERFTPSPNPMDGLTALWRAEEPLELPHGVGVVALVHAWQYFESGRAVALAPAPRLEGDVVHVTLDVSPRGTLARLELHAGADGDPAVPFVAEPVEAALLWPDAEGRHLGTFRTGPAGALEFGLPQDAGGAELRLWTASATERERSAAATLPSVLPRGVLALGTLVLEPSPLFVAGRVVEQDGTPVAGALVHVERTVGATTGPYGRAVRTDADGRFALYGRPPAGELALLVLRSYVRGVAPRVPFQAGADDVVVVLEPVATPTVTLRAAADVLAAAVDGGLVELVALDDSTRREGRPPAGGEAREGALRLEFEDMPAGAYALRLRLADAEDLTLAPRVEVAPETSELGTFDLHGRVHAHALRVVDEDGEALEGMVRLRAADAERLGPSVWRCPESGVTLATAAPRVDAYAWVSGVRTTDGLARNEAGDVEVVVRPAPRVLVEVPRALAAAQTSSGLTVRLEVGSLVQHAALDADGRAELALSALATLEGRAVTLALGRRRGPGEAAVLLPGTRQALRFEPGQAVVRHAFAFDDAQLAELLALLADER